MSAQRADAPAQPIRSASPSSSSSLSSVRPITFPKNRSATNIYSLHGTSPVPPIQAPRRGMSFDVGNSLGDGDGQQSTSVTASLGPSGLHRIRSIPNRMPSLARTTSAVDSRTAMRIKIPEISPTEIRANPGPMTAGVLNLSTSLNDDLRRFPSESLHSFSFSNTTDETLHARHNIIKRSVDFLREQPGWSPAQLGIAHAQAKVSGDHEVQSMMELLARTDFSSKHDALEQRAFTLGPLTGPAGMHGENVFEKQFMEQSDSPTSIDAPRLGSVDASAVSSAPGETLTPTQENFEFQTGSASLPKENALKINTSFGGNTATVVDEEGEDSGPIMYTRSALKRTYTDVGPLELQNRLTATLAQPYTTNDPSLLSPIGPSPSMSASSVFGPAFPSNAAHTHGRKVPTTQAIFTTETSEPWTITASNDLACLVFGVTKAELRKIGILELVKEEYRKWLLDRLRVPGSSSRSTPVESPTRTPLVGKNGSMMGNGITAKLLSKPSSRETGKGRRSKGPQDDSSPSPARARGVLLCGDVLPILKRNGTVSSASFWVQEKKSALIWVMEEIAEDVAYLRIDEIGCVSKGYGALEGVWGMERVKPGVDVARLIPAIPRRQDTNTGALDLGQIAAWRRFTARTANDISIPVTVDLLPDEPVLRIQSFPNIAGMVVLSASTLKVTSSNTAVTEALFGRSPNGISVTEIIPDFDKMLQLLVDQENIDLEEGLVIPEHSFRRARAMIAWREGRGDAAAAAFLRPSGLPAVHRDGAEIMVDVQMRIVKSEALNERPAGSETPEDSTQHSSELVYALWVTYSRTLHAVNHGVGPVSPLVSRPGTPPTQPSPGPHLPSMSSDESDTDDLKDRLPPPAVESPDNATKSGITTALTSSSSIAETPTAEGQDHRKSIADFQILEEMGAGAYGQVKLARNKLTGEKAVIKYVTKRRILVDTWTRDRRLGTVPLEIHVLDYLRRDGFKHPNIVEMSDFFEDDVNYYIEMVPHGLPGMDLFDCIELRVNMEEAECKRIFVQVASAIEYLHTKAKVVHRDIKDENVVLDGEGRVKLIDFGSASYIKNGPFDVFVGTIDYASPEVLAGRSYTGPEQDIWALGILLYTILYKENPFYSIDEIMDHDLRVPYLVSEESIELVRLMLERDVEKRVDIKQVMDHRWCQGIALPV